MATVSDDMRTRPVWRFIDGSLSVSMSMAATFAVKHCGSCADVPVLGLLRWLANQDDGTMGVAALLLFPSAVTLYGGIAVFFAAREAAREWAEKRFTERGRRQGHQEGRQEERERIRQAVAGRAAPISPAELAAILDDEAQ